MFLAMLVRATVMAWKEGRGTFITGTIVEKILSLVFYGAEIQVKKKRKKKKRKRKGKIRAKPKRSDEKWRLQNERFFIFLYNEAVEHPRVGWF